MGEIKLLPPIQLVTGIGLLVKGRVHFPKDSIGQVVHCDDEDFIPFRKVTLDPTADQPEQPGAIFEVRFHFAKFSARTNIRLSLIPIPFIIVQPGFRSKTWMLGEKSGAFRGLYEWDSLEDANNYWNSFPMKLMRNRAAEDSLTYVVNAL